MIPEAWGRRRLQFPFSFCNRSPDHRPRCKSPLYYVIVILSSMDGGLLKLPHFSLDSRAPVCWTPWGSCGTPPPPPWLAQTPSCSPAAWTRDPPKKFGGCFYTSFKLFYIYLFGLCCRSKVPSSPPWPLPRIPLLLALSPFLPETSLSPKMLFFVAINPTFVMKNFFPSRYLEMSKITKYGNSSHNRRDD